MEKPCLSDKNKYPDDKVLKRYLGEATEAWGSFCGFIKARYPAFSMEWRYYNDGRRWLCKITKKKNTICWVSVYSDMFKTTFYFADKAESLIVNSKLRKKYIDQFIEGKRYGKIRGITVNIKKTVDLSSTKKLIAIKEQLS